MQHEPKKIALFVDFDNIYLGLRETSREAAEAFAMRPHVWLRWIELGMPIGEADPAAPRENRVLIRQCYLNPDTFGKYRGYFTRAGFTVVDCPSLTSRGKNSSDIVMVMDILDALRHETRFDRFVIMSADADFTPVLQRLRAHDRRTAVMVSGLAAPAYRAACDRLIEEDVFIEHALEIAPAPEPPPDPVPAVSAVTAIRDPELLAAIGRRVYEEASSSGVLPASELPRILREFKEFTPTSNWLGYYSLQALTEAVLVHRPELRITDDDPWRIAVRLADEPAEAPAASAGPPSPPADAEPDWEALRERVLRVVARMVAESAEPVVMGKAAHAAILEVGPRLTETRWLGRGTFKALLLSARELPFRVVASPLPGFVYDPERHQPPSERASVDGLAELDPEMASLIRRINQLTDAPKLTPRQYRVLWEVLAKELGRAPYNLMGTGKSVRDQCVERGEPIARQAITWVLRGLGYVGYRFDEPRQRPEELAAAYRGNLLTILRQAQVTLSGDELRMLDDWLLASAGETQAGDADGGAEPDYAAWADALLAEAARDFGSPPAAAEPAAVSKDADPAGPTTWPPPDALLFEPMEEPPPRTGKPFEWPPVIPARKDEPLEWPPRDALFFEPTHPEPEADLPPPLIADRAEADNEDDWPPADALPLDPTPDAAPADTPPELRSEMQMQDDDAISADEQPAHPAIEGDAEASDVVSAEWQLSTDSAPSDVLPAAPAPEGDAQPDVVTADWQMSDESSASGESSSAPDSASGDAQPADAAHVDVPAEDDIVPADWLIADEPSAPGAEPDVAHPSVEARHDGAAPNDDVLSAEWQPAKDAPAPAQEHAASSGLPAPEEASPPASSDILNAEWQSADESAPTSDPADQTPSAAPPPQPPRASAVESDIVAAEWQPVDADDIFAAAWEPAAGPTAPANPPSASSAETAPGEPRAPEPADDDVVTPQWEVVADGTWAGGSHVADANPEPAAQMDAFPPDPTRGEPPAPEQVPAELSAAPEAAPPCDDPPRAPQWWQ